MKIGILTFHWGTNYGAIIQAYALQTYLEKNGHEVYIINYRPKRFKKSLINCFRTPRVYLYLSNIAALLKEKKLINFRDLYLNQTRLYESSNELKKTPPDLDVYVCGSDQIWNPSFTSGGEGKPTSTYFLDFGDKNIKRVAYAVSFGCVHYPERAFNIAKNHVRSFDAISVREDSGLNIVSKLGFRSPIKLPDPTLLLKASDYVFPVDNTINNDNSKVAFFYMLRNEQSRVKSLELYLQSSYKLISADEKFKPLSLEEWIRGIKNASIVITNSFHGMCFSLIFHIPFIVIPAIGKAGSMNDRFFTLLSYLNLEDRMMSEYNVNKTNSLISNDIDWKNVDEKINNLKMESDNFFNQILTV